MKYPDLYRFEKCREKGASPDSWFVAISQHNNKNGIKKPCWHHIFDELTMFVSWEISYSCHFSFIFGLHGVSLGNSCQVHYFKYPPDRFPKEIHQTEAKPLKGRTRTNETFFFRLNDLCKISWLWARTSNHRSPVTSALFVSHNLCFRHLNNWIIHTGTDLNGLHPWWQIHECHDHTASCNKTFWHVIVTSSVLLVGKLFGNFILEGETDSVWVDPSSAWLSTNTRRQDERKRWLVLHVALPRLEAQTWWYFWHVAAFPTIFFREIACISIYIYIYTSSGEIAS